jgi:hypothetical protein
MNRKDLLIAVVLALAVVGVIAYTHPRGSGTKSFQQVAAETTVPASAIAQGVPADTPYDIPFYPGITPADVHIDTTHSDNYFYSVDASLADVQAFFEKQLKGYTEHVNGSASVTFDIEQNGYRTNIFVSSDKPTIYPKEFTGGKTYISVSFNLDPLPSAEDILK